MKEKDVSCLNCVHYRVCKWRGIPFVGSSSTGGIPSEDYKGYKDGWYQLHAQYCSSYSPTGDSYKRHICGECKFWNYGACFVESRDNTATQRPMWYNAQACEDFAKKALFKWQVQ